MDVRIKLYSTRSTITYILPGTACKRREDEPTSTLIHHDKRDHTRSSHTGGRRGAADTLRVGVFFFKIKIQKLRLG